LGERNRNKNIFESLPKILRSESMIKAKKVLNESDKDVDDIFLWIENNAAMEFSTEDLPRVYELLSVADMMREHVIKQQNWRFKGIMADLLSGISSIRTKENHKFIMYKMSDRISLLGRTRAKRAEMDEKCKTLTQELHCSSRKVKTEYLPYMEMF